MEGSNQVQDVKAETKPEASDRLMVKQEPPELAHANAECKRDPYMIILDDEDEDESRL